MNSCPVCKTPFKKRLEKGIHECGSCGARVLFKLGKIYQIDHMLELDDDMEALLDSFNTESSKKAVDRLFTEDVKVQIPK